MRDRLCPPEHGIEKTCPASDCIRTLDHSDWIADPSQFLRAAAVSGLEAGDVLFFPQLRFEIEPSEAPLFTPFILGKSKNASFDPTTGKLAGIRRVDGQQADSELLTGLVRRFSERAAVFVDHLLPDYHGNIVRGRASFRPAEIAGRVTSWRKDDTRLHVDSFPATPSGGRRILRVFTNVNPDGRPRRWRVGDDFETVARRFHKALRMPVPGSGLLLSLLRITKTARSAYDALMLQLHDRMKADERFQKESRQTVVDFPTGSSWVAFTDQVSHAAMSGQYQLEQTFMLPVDAMRDQSRSPLRILERLMGRRLS
ncbi:MAG TPA: Kdo hydroxylase family protein [Vicinamibacterales bacterium]|nr:Kdo hydroxylase family protein [Vicinamibacterales bacterium]